MGGFGLIKGLYKNIKKTSMNKFPNEYSAPWINNIKLNINCKLNFRNKK